MNIAVPLTVPKSLHTTFIDNYKKATQGTGRLLLFAADQKIEHLNKDFYGDNISTESADPEHLFKIASSSRIGAFATQLGLIARYAHAYADIPYVVKLNSKTDLVPTNQQDPISYALHTVDQVAAFAKQTNLSIVGVGYTIYLGSEHEAHMLHEAAQIIYEAHQHGMITIVWIYPRGKAVTNERDGNLIAGAAGVAACLGADFTKLNPPHAADLTSAQFLARASTAAGNTKIICSGGALKNESDFIDELYDQITIGKTQGAAVGRNIHQKNLADAQHFCAALASIIFDNTDATTAKKLLRD